MNKNFLNNDSFLPSNAVACILTISNKYIVQLRDDKPDIFFPGFWSLFGGQVEDNEGPDEALRRELFEELNLEINSNLKYFTSLEYDFSFCGLGKYYRKYYTYEINNKIYSELRLGEGQSFDQFDAKALLSKKNFVPYDSFVLWMHYKNNKVNEKIYKY